MPDQKQYTPDIGTERRQYRRTAERRQEILVSVVQLLSEPDCHGVTTKEIAKFMGVADGALYRHFSGKAEILNELIGFCNTAFEGMFSEINAEAGVTMLTRAKVKARALLLFAEANPGLTRLLTGEILCGESDVVRDFMNETLRMTETAIARTLELAAIQREVSAEIDCQACAAVIMSYVQGRWARFVASGFREQPTADWKLAEELLFSGMTKDLRP